MKMQKNMHEVAFTVDVEQDIPPYLDTWEGMEKGFPALLDILSRYKIRATLFVTGQTAEKFPELIREASKEHEIGCHGYAHEEFNTLGAEDQFKCIQHATSILAKITGYRPIGFRAPRFRANLGTFAALERASYLYDSSRVSYKPGQGIGSSKLIELPNTLPSLFFLRIPAAFSTRIWEFLINALPVTVLSLHNWELVKMKGARFASRFATGETALRRLDKLLDYLCKKGANFKPMREIAESKQMPRKRR
jgi:peptidoglycan/xylan/chitin deacetylase (PgdA/CDA1 family)